MSYARQMLDACRRTFNIDAGLLAARERGSFNAGICQDGIYLLGANKKCLKHTSRKARAAEDFFELQRTLRDVGSML